MVKYCSYHGQDVERAVGGGGLMLAFGDLADTSDGRVEIGRIVEEELEGQGLKVEWDGEAKKRINISGIEWQRRAA